MVQAFVQYHAQMIHQLLISMVQQLLVKTLLMLALATLVVQQTIVLRVMERPNVGMASGLIPTFALPIVSAHLLKLCLILQ
jgi:hypothetical protein